MEMENKFNLRSKFCRICAWSAFKINHLLEIKRVLKFFSNRDAFKSTMALLVLVLGDCTNIVWV